MNKTTIYLIRHGATPWNEASLIQGRVMTHLSDSGRKNAIKAAHFFARQNIKIDAVMVSPLPRARETYEIYASLMKLPKGIIDEAITERAFGPFNSMTVKEAIPQIATTKDPSVETVPALSARGLHEMRRLHKLHPGKTILLFTHAQFTKGVLVGIDPRIDFWFWLRNCSYSIIEVNDHDCSILGYNITEECPQGDHLPS